MKEDIEILDLARKLRNEYYRKYRAKPENKAKSKEATQNYWLRKAKELKTQQKQGE